MKKLLLGIILASLLAACGDKPLNLDGLNACFECADALQNWAQIQEMAPAIESFTTTEVSE